MGGACCKSKEQPRDGCDDEGMGDMQKQIEKAQKEQIAEQKELRKLIERQQSGVLRDLKGAGAEPTPIRESRCGSSS